MVALKLPGEHELISLVPRSRNAVVALKPGLAGAVSAAGSVKQERRGGIETLRSSLYPRSVASKQERRGGIETRLRIQSGIVTCTKQERRGGIETHQNPGSPLSGRKEAGTPWWH